jgi:hypothetical protein
MSKYLTRAEAAQHLTERGLPITKNTLQKMATVGGGPPYARFGNRAIYEPGVLDQWAEQKISPPQRSTSDNTA